MEPGDARNKDRAPEELVGNYLDRLRAAGWGLPPDRRDELEAEVREHIDAALRVDRGAVAEVATRNVLDRLGPPEEIVRAEIGDAPPPVTRPPAQNTAGGLEISALVTLAVGAIVLPVFGPALGVILAWLSPRWTTPQKLVASGLSLLPALTIAYYLIAGS